MGLRVLKMSGVASLQGLPQFGHKDHGLPQGGAFDQRSYLIASVLVGNVSGEACLEVGWGGVVLEATSAVSLAVVGCRTKIRGRELSSGTAFEAKLGELVELGPPFAARSYLAVAGGWESWNQKALVGGGSSALGPRSLDLHSPLSVGSLRLLPSRGQEGAVVDVECRVTPKLDRMGIRLDCPGAARPGIRSEPVTFGTVQALPSGGLIVLGPDAPTVGGYCKLGAVCRVDWDRLGQIKPGNAVRFVEVTLDHARRLWDAYEEETEHILRRIIPNAE